MLDLCFEYFAASKTFAIFFIVQNFFLLCLLERKKLYNKTI